MADPWLVIIGLGEDGPEALPPASRAALDAAEVIVGGPRHLALAAAGNRGREWPRPFDIAPVLALRGRRVVVLASGDPFWFGAGSVLAAALAPGDWVSHPAPSSFQLAANRLGWRLEETLCLGLHAAPPERLVPVLRRGARILATVRDGKALAGIGARLRAEGFGASRLVVLERLGGPSERVRACGPDDLPDAVETPLMLAIEAQGAPGLPATPGLPEHLFAHDGQITKAPIRALTLAALAPRPGERLWDLGAGSGSVSVEWALAGGIAEAVETRADRAATIRENVARFGLGHRIGVIEGAAAGVLDRLAPPEAVFVGGGLDAGLLAALWARVPAGCRIVANAVTIETEALLAAAQVQHGGSLMRVSIERAEELGRMRGWTAARPVVQWSAVR